MPWDRESTEEYDEGYTRESFERADEDTPETLQEPKLWVVVVVFRDGDIDTHGPYANGYEANWAAQCLMNQVRNAERIITQEMI